MPKLQTFVLLAVTAFLAVPPGAEAAALSGTWSGSGYVNPKDGKRERVRCRVTYTRESQKVFRVKAVCATTSVKINQTGEVLMVNERRYVGDFYNAEYDVSGRIGITLRGGSQTVTFSGSQGHGSMTLRKR